MSDGIFSKFFQSIRNFFSGGGTPESELKSSANQMLRTLELQAEATSFAMARADDVRSKLQSELDNYESLRREAERFLQDGDEASARRVVALQLQSQEAITRLKAEYDELQRDAEQKVLQYKNSEEEVGKRVKALPKLEQDAYMLREEKRIQDATSKFKLENPQNTFDKVQQELDIRRKQLQNRNLLTADPNAELDRKIRESIGERKIDDALAELRQKINQGSSINADFREIPHIDPVAEAQKALESPRYSGLGLSMGDKRDPQTLPAKKPRVDIHVEE